MRAETTQTLDEIKQSIELLRRHLDWDVALTRLSELDALTQDQSLWDDPDRAQKLMQERTRLEKQIEDVKALDQAVEDAVMLIELGEAEGDDDTVAEAEKELEAVRAKSEKMQIESMLSGEADGLDCYLEVHAGAGGTEAQDWAEMLLRMYTRWAERKGYKLEWLEESAGEEAGLKSATIKISGHNAYGWLKTESGVHRLVRISPYDSQARRHTSFSSAWIYPVVDDSIDIVIEDKDLKVDTYRASGAGGQHVNRTDSAIRITHIPSGIVVQCQNDRSQHRNRATAMDMLRARLYEAELQRREEEANATEASKSDIGWGHQIRSYVLQPYQMVKDLRTGHESGNPTAVLDGDIDAFLEASLAGKVGMTRDGGDAAAG
ncbi:peptide chain release factor 2 [Thalassobaculum sp.]|uniref:peptide chain release factor 2 n=1 Tax=Thalassobaculum sp. TaxID=2022740 RepID=UPI003B5B410C